MTAGTRTVPGGRRNSPLMRTGIPSLNPVRNCLSVGVKDSRVWISILAVCTGIYFAEWSRPTLMAGGDTLGHGESERLRLIDLTPSNQIQAPTMGAASSRL